MFDFDSFAPQIPSWDFAPASSDSFLLHPSSLPKRDAFSVGSSVPITPEQFLQIFLGPGLALRKSKNHSGICVDYADRKIHFFVESTAASAVCPVCGCVSHSLKACKLNSHNPQHLPVNGFGSYLHISTKSWRCRNESCSVKTFTESIEGFKQGQHRSDALNTMILSVSVHTSDNAAARILGEQGVRISHDAVGDLLRHIEVKDEPDVEEIGIDDVATRKGIRYCTVIYDLKSHRLLALLKGRDGAELRKWLKKHPKVRLVCRDRDSCYARVIREVCGSSCVQIADRFHLFQNLMNYIKDDFKYSLPASFFAYKGRVVSSLKGLAAQKPFLKDLDLIHKKELKEMDFDNSPLLDEEGKPVLFIQTLHPTDTVRLQKERDEEYALACQIRQRWAEAENAQAGLKRDELAAGFRTPYAKVCRYLRLSQRELEELKQIRVRKPRNSVMDPYKNMICKALQAGHPALRVAHYLVKKGCKESAVTIAAWVAAISNNNFGTSIDARELIRYKYPPEVKVIRRNELLKYITIRDRKKMAETAAATFFDQILEMYPQAALIDTIWNRYHEVIMGEDPDQLDGFLNRYEGTCIQPLINGIKKDIAAVKHAISYPHSSGFVEGGNTRFKAVKRVGFGRSKLQHLFLKTYAVSIIMRTGTGVSELLEKWLITSARTEKGWNSSPKVKEESHNWCLKPIEI